MKNINHNQQSTQLSFVLGMLLILVGASFLVSQLFGIRIGQYAWPLFIIAPGLFLFILALSMEGESGGALAAIGSVVTMTGLLLFFQNMTNTFQSWAYGWALVSLTAVGLGQMVFGSLKGHVQMVRNGKRLATIGITIFLIGALFFELIIGISGFGIGYLGRIVWPILLIGAGAFFLMRTMWSGSTDRQS